MKQTFIYGSEFWDKIFACVYIVKSLRKSELYLIRNTWAAFLVAWRIYLLDVKLIFLSIKTYVSVLFFPAMFMLNQSLVYGRYQVRNLFDKYILAS
jgi:hypothetical protein